MNTKRLSQLGLLTATALILGYIEYLLPLFPALPGVKLGLGNVAVLWALYAMDKKSAVLLCILKAVLCGLLFGGPVYILYSLAGGLLSLCVMALAMRLRGVSVVGVSITGAVFHNVGQVLLALLLVGRAVLAYLPALLLAGAITGALTGLVAKLVLHATGGNRP